MKYRISFQGWENEVLISESTEKMFNHFKENNLDVSDHMCGNMEDELSKEITDGVCYDSKFECDGLYHNCGPFYNGSVDIVVSRVDTDQEVYISNLNEFNGDATCEQEIYYENFDCRYVMVGQIFSKGYASEYILELKDDEEFDPKKLNLLYNDIDEDFQIVTGLQYNEIDLECTGELDTRGKSESWFIIDTETGEQTIQE